jgi:hypothetical protein
LPLKRIRGQITQLLETPQSAALKTVVCAEGYVAPGRLGEHTVGASFDFHNEDLTTTPEGHQGNLDLLEEISPDLVQRLGEENLNPQTLQGWAAFRCTSPDYLPIVGPLADAEAFSQAYAVLSKDARQVPDTECPWLDGLYVNSGHGSRGLITAPLSGELLAAWINDEPLPLPRPVAEACHPNRFAVRALVRRLENRPATRQRIPRAAGANRPLRRPDPRREQAPLVNFIERSRPRSLDKTRSFIAARGIFTACASFGLKAWLAAMPSLNRARAAHIP